MGHIEGSDNELLALGCGIGVEPVGEAEKAHLGGDISMNLILLRGTGERDDEEHEPRQADLKVHLKIEDANARAKLGSHKEIIDVISGHAESVAADMSVDVEVEAHSNTTEDGRRKERPKVVDNVLELEGAGEMQTTKNGHGGVEGPDGIAIVWQALSVKVLERIAEGGDTRKSDIEDGLDDGEAPEDGEGLPCGGSALEGVRTGFSFRCRLEFSPLQHIRKPRRQSR